jgi:hypothetical protein
LPKKAIEKYKHWVGICLARLIPYQRIYASQLKQDKRFIDACEQYGLSISEGMVSIFGCHKIRTEKDASEIIVWRREQGYKSQNENRITEEI